MCDYRIVPTFEGLILCIFKIWAAIIVAHKKPLGKWQIRIRLVLRVECIWKIRSGKWTNWNPANFEDLASTNELGHHTIVMRYIVMTECILYRENLQLTFWIIYWIFRFFFRNFRIVWMLVTICVPKGVHIANHYYLCNKIWEKQRSTYISLSLSFLALLSFCLSIWFVFYGYSLDKDLGATLSPVKSSLYMTYLYSHIKTTYYRNSLLLT